MTNLEKSWNNADIQSHVIQEKTQVEFNAILGEKAFQYLPSPTRSGTLRQLYDQDRVIQRTQAGLIAQDLVKLSIDDPRLDVSIRHHKKVEQKPQDNGVLAENSAQAPEMKRVGRQRSPGLFEKQDRERNVKRRKYIKEEIGSVNFPSGVALEAQHPGKKHFTPKDQFSTKWVSDKEAKEIARKPWREILSLQSSKDVYMPFDAEHGVTGAPRIKHAQKNVEKVGARFYEGAPPAKNWNLVNVPAQNE